MKDITVQTRQTLEDIAVQYYGAVEGIEHLLNDNRTVLVDGFDTKLVQGTILRIREGEPVDEKALAEITRLGIKPASGQKTEALPDGKDHNEDYNIDHY